MMNRIFVGLGSNLGNRQYHLEECINRLLTSRSIFLKQVSSLYETEPVGYLLQEPFLNMVIEIAYSGSPFNLLDDVKTIEKLMGRNTLFHWGPRNIDIDILYYGAQIVKTNSLCIPHPEIHKRMFVLQPMAEIAPEFRCPVSGLTMFELSHACIDESRVAKFTISAQETLFQEIRSL